MNQIKIICTLLKYVNKRYKIKANLLYMSLEQRVFVSMIQVNLYLYFFDLNIWSRKVNMKFSIDEVAFSGVVMVI